LLGCGCKGEPVDVPWCSDDATPAASAAATPPTWTEIGPLFGQKCGSCHTEGGHAPFSVATLDDVLPWLSSIRVSVASRAMPPWLAAGCCQSWFQDYSLSDEEVEEVDAWIDAGAPAGEGTGAALTPIGGLSRTDLSLTMPEPYTPRGSDEVRCFVFTWPESERVFVTGLEPLPGNRSIVHHLLVSMVAPADADEVDEADEADPSPGFDCTGGLGSLPSPTPLGGSLLGGDYPRGIGTPIEPGSRILLQVHYSVEGEAAPDQTSLDFRIDSEAVATSTMYLANPGWMIGTGMSIPAGEADATFFYRYRPTLYTQGKPVQIEGVTPHMHRYATRMRVLALHADGTDDCLLEIPEWRFGWEQPYWFADPVTLGAEDELYIECHFDNSAGNQPEGAEPRDIAWGDSDQDMCAAFLWFTREGG
jgi:hypothetical protein